MTLGRYQVTGTLGRGASGTVYRARGPSGEDVAIKVIVGASPEARTRFERERRLLASLGEGFVPLLEAGEAPTGPYIVMPFVPGGTLRDRLLREPRLPVDEARSLGIRIADALGRAHEKRIVHRDLKPENVLFTAEGEPLVADLGLAKHFERSAADLSVTLSQHGELRGTAGYMAREQLADASAADARSDVFSVSAVAYEMLAGEPAFAAETLVELFQRLDRGVFAPLRSLRPDVPVELARAIERGLSRRPEDRFADGAALAAALRARERRSRAPLLLAVSLVVLGVLGVGSFFAWPRAAPPPATSSPPPKAPPPPPPSPALAHFAKARALAKEKNAQEAIAEFGAGLAFQPDAAAYVERGVLEEVTGDATGALEDYGRACELDPKNAMAWSYHGTILSRLGRNAEALADMERAVALDPGFTQVWINGGNAEVWLQRFDEAEKWFAHAVELDPGNAEAWYGRGSARWRQKDLERALADFDRALALDKETPEYWINSAACALDAERWERAAHDASEAIRLAPRRAVVWELRAGAESGLGQLDAAIADEEQAKTLDPHMETTVLGMFFHRRGEQRAGKGDREGAISDLERCIALSKPGSSAAAEARKKLSELRR